MNRRSFFGLFLGGLGLPFLRPVPANADVRLYSRKDITEALAEGEEHEMLTLLREARKARGHFLRGEFDLGKLALEANRSMRFGASV